MWLLICPEIRAALSLLLLQRVNTVVWLKSSCWLPLSASLHRRCLTSPPNPSRRRLTVTPQMASLYSSSLMPAPSPSRWYPAWGKKWSVTVAHWAISWLQAESWTQRAVVLSTWLIQEEGGRQVTRSHQDSFSTKAALLQNRIHFKNWFYTLIFGYFQCRFRCSVFIISFCLA